MQIAFVYFDVDTGYAASVHHGLAYLFGALRAAGHEAVLFHVTTGDALDAAASEIQARGFAVVALSLITNQKKHLRRFLSRLQVKPRWLVAGGVHMTLVKGAALEEFAELDGVCIGEGEIPLRELVDRVADGREVTATPGFCFRVGGRIVQNPVPALVPVDELPFPDYAPFDVRRVVRENASTFPMMLGRGCPYSCSYCCNHAIRTVYPSGGRYVRRPSVDRAIAIIRANLALAPETRRIIFADDTFTVDAAWLSEFCRRYAAEIHLPFICNARVEAISRARVADLEAAGCVSIDFGVETGNEWLRHHVLNRRHSNRRIEEAFALVQARGIRTFSFNIVGLPFETKEMAADTLRLNRRLQPNFGKCFYFFPFPGSRIHELCREFGLLPDDAETVSGYLERPVLKPVSMTHGETTAALERLQAFFNARLLLSRLPVPGPIERALTALVIALRHPFLWAVDPVNPNPVVRQIRRVARRLALAYLR